MKVHNFNESKNKYRYAYLLTPSGIAEEPALTGRFLQRKLLECEAMRVEIESLRGEGGEGSKGKDCDAGSEVPADTEVSRTTNSIVPSGELT